MSQFHYMRWCFLWCSRNALGEPPVKQSATHACFWPWHLSVWWAVSFGWSSSYIALMSHSIWMQGQIAPLFSCANREDYRGQITWIRWMYQYAGSGRSQYLQCFLLSGLFWLLLAPQRSFGILGSADSSRLHLLEELIQHHSRRCSV